MPSPQLFTTSANFARMRQLVVWVALLAMAGCANNRLTVAQPNPCFADSADTVLAGADPDTRSAVGLFYREWSRAQAAGPPMQAAMLERLRTLYTSHADWPKYGWDCGDALPARQVEALQVRPLPLSRLTLAQIRMVHTPEILLALADLPIGDITPYLRAEGEVGPSPSAQSVRYVALTTLPVWAAAANNPQARAWIFNRLDVSTDDWELLLLHPAMELLMKSMPRAGDDPSGNRQVAKRIAASWVGDIRQRLVQLPEPASLELAIHRISDLGTFGPPLGVGLEAQHVLEHIIEVKGHVPLTHGVAGAAEDLAEVAFEALANIDDPDIFRSHTYKMPHARRSVFGDERWRTPPVDFASMPPGAVERRIADLEGKLQTIKASYAHRYLTQQLAAWTPPRDARRRFDALTQALFEGEGFKMGPGALFQVWTAMTLELADSSPQRQLLLRLLQLTPEQTLLPDTDYGRRIKARRAFWVDPVISTAVGVMAKRPQWVERDPALRAWLSARAQEAIPTETGAASLERKLDGAYRALLDFHVSDHPDADPAEAKTIVASWMVAVRGLSREDIKNAYTGDIWVQRIHGLGDYGRQAGLADEVRAFLRADPSLGRFGARAESMLK